jgi:hypothetical protein
MMVESISCVSKGDLFGDCVIVSDLEFEVKRWRAQLVDDARREEEASGLEVAVAKGWFGFGEKCPEGVKSTHCESIHQDGSRFHQKECS